MKNGIFASIAVICFAGQAALADLPRTAVRTTPRVFNRDIERFVLLTPLVVDHSISHVPYYMTIFVTMLPGTFVPVSEDEGGVFYQAANGFRLVRFGQVVSGGVYVNKLSQGRTWVYTGDARIGAKFEIKKDIIPLSQYELRGLRAEESIRTR